VSESGGTQWGFFRRPALLGPMVGFLAFLAAEAIRQPADFSGGSWRGDWIIFFGLFVMVATLFSAIPYLLGAFLLLAACRVFPVPWVQVAVFRVALGGLIGAAIGWPFAHALNWIPSASPTEPRFNLVSVIVASAVAGGYCAIFLCASFPARRA
jgi:hypothetical protein